MTLAGRPTIDLDGDWRFIPDPERLHAPDELPAGEPIHVPGCWEAQVPRPYRIITAWYRRSFDVPAAWEGDAVLLSFGAVMYACTVWLNGRRLGSHEGGYTPFVLAARDEVLYGETNELAVEVQNPLNAIADYPALAVERVLSAEQYAPELPLSEAPHGKQTWYSSQSGIWKSVRAERAGVAFVASLVVLPDAAGERARLRYRVERTVGDRPLALSVAIDGPDGAEVAARTIEIEPDGQSGELTVDVPRPTLWTLDAPAFYRVRVRLLADGLACDEGHVRFGMRDVGVRDGMVTLNGEPVYLRGALDQDLYPDTISTPPSRAFLDDQLRRVKELGLNLLRCHIKVPDPAYLDAADEAGVLVWCELPNWTRFSHAAAARGQATLEQMVESMGNHPSLVIWTIINEDWGTRLRYERRDREWLGAMYDHLKELDPTRLVVDNSACETSQTPNFHVRSDLADFHIYFSSDNAVRWRNAIAEFARRPAWLWSPHGDARPRGDEPLVLSEFGSWGLPRLDRLIGPERREPWWFGTGHGYYRPSGLRRRFVRYGLDRMWPDVSALAEATQWSQFEALQYQIGELRRHAAIAGYVVTELSDAYWEANGLLDATRGPKAYHGRMGDINADDVVLALADRRDLASGGRLTGELVLASHGRPPPDGGGRVEWRLELDGGATVAGARAVPSWPPRGVAGLGRFEVPVPDVSEPTDGRLIVRAIAGDGVERARDELGVAVIPGPTGAPARPVAVHDPLDIWHIRRRLESLGHRVVDAEEAETIVATQLTADLLRQVEQGATALVLVRSRDALPPDLELTRRVTVHLRRLPHEGAPGQRSPWEGDWVTNFSWIAPGTFPELPYRAPLDLTYAEVAPDHVLLGYDPVRHRDEVTAGIFVGWVHEPAALAWTFRQGAGAITLTTFRLAPESGPLASRMLQCFIEQLASRSARGRTRTLTQRAAS